jgi:sugar (pentulose or hexulose) kinase
MKKQIALGLDLGTSGVRVLAVDAKGKVIAEVNKQYRLLTPQPGWTAQMTGRNKVCSLLKRWQKRSRGMMSSV